MSDLYDVTSPKDDDEIPGCVYNPTYDIGMVEEVESEGMPLDHSPSVGLDATDPNANESKQERNDQVQSTGCSPDDLFRRSG